MNKYYTVQQNDRLSRISTKFYGVPDNVEKIISANPILIERRNKNILAADNLPVIYAGNILTIPEPESEKQASDTIETENENAITLVIDGKRFVFFTDFTINSNIGQFDTVTINSPYFDTQEARETFLPLIFKECAVYYGKDLFLDGILIAPIADLNADSETLSLNIYPKCGILNDSNMPISMFPLEFNGLDLKQIAETLCGVFSIGVEFIGDAGPIYEKVSMNITDSPLSFIIDLAKKRGFLVTNNKKGNLLIWKATEENSNTLVKEGDVPFISCNPSFDPQKYYSEITGLTEEKEISGSDSYTWKNPFLKTYSKYLNIEFNDIDNAELKSSVEAAAGRMFGNAGKYNLVLNTHRNNEKVLFEKNQTIRAFAPKANIYNETLFLIESVVLSRKTSDADTAEISLVLPGAYTGSLPEVVPWVP